MHINMVSDLKKAAFYRGWKTHYSVRYIPLNFKPFPLAYRVNHKRLTLYIELRH